MQRCWATSPKERFTAAEVCCELQALESLALPARSAAARLHSQAAASLNAVVFQSEDPKVIALSKALEPNSPFVGEDPEVAALAQSLKAMDVASAPLCLKFAKALDEQGILTMERLKKLPEADAREALEAAGMKKLQIRTVMEAVTPPPAVAPVPAAQVSLPSAPKSSPPVFNESPTCVATLVALGDEVNVVAF